MDKKQLMVIEKYTQPFVQLVFEKGEQDLVFEKLTQIKGIFEETGLANFLAHIGVEDEEKAKSLRLFQPSDSQLLDHLIEVVILNHREALFYDIVRVSMDQIQQLSNCFEVTVSSVAGLDQAQKEKLIPIIEKKFGIQVRSLKEELDPDLIGGFVVSANHKMLDTSLKRQLQVIKANLK